MPELLLTLLAFAQVQMAGKSQIAGSAGLNALGTVSTPGYYVATNGNDSWSCTLTVPTPTISPTDGPCLTLTHAQTLMQTGRKITRVRGGTYTLGAILNFTTSDNGETWEAYGSETPVIDGNSGAYYVRNEYASSWSWLGFTMQNMYGTGTAEASLVACDPGHGPCANVTVRWNTISGCNYACILGAALNNSLIDSNTLTGQTNIGGAAILLYSYPFSDTVSHNSVSNCQGSGILLERAAAEPFDSTNNLVDRNIVSNANNGSMQTDDGAIYMTTQSGTATGNQITNNIVYNNGGSAPYSNAIKGIYLDDGTSNVTISGNVVGQPVGYGEYGIQIHGGKNNTVQNNIFDISTSPSSQQLGLYQSSTSIPGIGMTGNVITHNIYYTSGNWPTYAWNVGFSGSDTCMADGPTYTTNDYYSATAQTYPNNSNVSCAAFTDPSPLVQNPGFTSPSTGNYTMSNPPSWWVALPTNQGPLPYSP